jgi:hypothetical protein
MSTASTGSTRDGLAATGAFARADLLAAERRLNFALVFTGIAYAWLGVIVTLDSAARNILTWLLAGELAMWAVMAGTCTLMLAKTLTVLERTQRVTRETEIRLARLAREDAERAHRELLTALGC